MMVQNSDIIVDIFNIVWIFTSGNYGSLTFVIINGLALPCKLKHQQEIFISYSQNFCFALISLKFQCVYEETNLNPLYPYYKIS